MSKTQLSVTFSPYSGESERTGKEATSNSLLEKFSCKQLLISGMHLTPCTSRSWWQNVLLAYHSLFIFLMLQFVLLATPALCGHFQKRILFSRHFRKIPRIFLISSSPPAPAFLASIPTHTCSEAIHCLGQAWVMYPVSLYWLGMLWFKREITAAYGVGVDGPARVDFLSQKT